MDISSIFSIAAVCFFLLGTIPAAVAFVWWRTIRQFVLSAEPTEGTVIELIESRGSRGGRFYSPVVEYMDSFGQRHEHRSKLATNSPYSVGDIIPMLYDRHDPDSAKINHWFRLYIGPLVCLFIGVDFVFMAIIFVVVAQFMG